MKKFLFCIVILNAVLFANAQTINTQSSKNTAHASSVNKKIKRAKNKSDRTSRVDTINNRKIYVSKKTGQAATPTGQDATGTNGSHSSNPKIATRKEK